MSGPVSHEGHDGTKSVVNGTRVTVAFPFSQIKLEEPSEHLRLLAGLVADMANALAPLVDSEVAKGFQRRAHELLAAIG